MPTPFQKSVWQALKKIPKGKVTTYALLAKFLETGAVRAVGTAVGKNPDAPQVPCHRVVRSDGTIGNYSALGGKNQKIAILMEEGMKIKNEKIIDLEKVLFRF